MLSTIQKLRGWAGHGRSCLAAATLGALCLLSGPRPTIAKPNVIMLMTDDQGYGDLGCHGNTILRTPNIDRFHENAVRLTNFHVSPTCSPTRGALLTGRDTNRVGTWHTIMGRSLLYRDEVTLADLFRGAGYRTAMFGKWHLGENYPFRPHDRGFDESLTFGGGAIGNAQDYWGNDLFDDTYLRNGVAEKVSGYCTDVWFREALRFIASNRDRPFLVYLPTNAPHRPFVVPERYSSHYKGLGIESPLAEFYGMIENIDENFGRLLDRLEELDLARETIIIFMTDNGSAMGGRAFNSGMRGAKGSEYEGGHRVPFFIRWAGGGIAGGRDIEKLAAHIDVLPTLAELADLQLPSTTQLDGTSLVPLLRDGAAPWPERILITDSQRVDHPVKWRKSAVMEDRWRLINGGELYDLRADPRQAADISAEHPGTVARLRQAYETWWAGLAPSLSRYARIVLGSDRQNPTWLSTHDIHGEVVWLQSQVEEGMHGDGYWSVEVERAGLYEIRLRRWPVEVDRPIRDETPPSGADSSPRAESSLVEISGARLRLGSHDITKPVPAGATEASFRLRLLAGPANLQAHFVSGRDEGRAHAAYYVGVQRLDEPL